MGLLDRRGRRGFRLRGFRGPGHGHLDPHDLGLRSLRRRKGHKGPRAERVFCRKMRRNPILGGKETVELREGFAFLGIDGDRPPGLREEGVQDFRIPDAQDGVASFQVQEVEEADRILRRGLSRDGPPLNPLAFRREDRNLPRAHEIQEGRAGEKARVEP